MIRSHGLKRKDRYSLRTYLISSNKTKDVFSWSEKKRSVFLENIFNFIPEEDLWNEKCDSYSLKDARKSIANLNNFTSLEI